MSEILVRTIVTLLDSELEDEKLQEAVQNLQLEAREVDGVREAELIIMEEAPTGSKTIGGFLLDKFKAVVSLEKLPDLIKTLAGRLVGGQIIKIKAEGNGKKLEIELSKPEDLAKLMPEVNKFIDG